MRNKNILFLVVFLFGMACVSMAQIGNSYPIRLQWNGVMEERNNYDTLSYINLQSAEYVGAMPVYCESFPIFDQHVDVKAQLNKVVTVPLTPEEMQIAKEFSLTLTTTFHSPYFSFYRKCTHHASVEVQSLQSLDTMHSETPFQTLFPFSSTS